MQASWLKAETKQVLRLLPLCIVLLVSACATSHPTQTRRGLFTYDENAAPEINEHASSRGASFASGGNRSCRPLSMRDRLDLLNLASPANFPATKYRRGAQGSAVDKATDCSHFVHEIYRRAGLGYGFKDTSQLKDAPEFELLPEEEAMPGDMMLFRGHVGLVDHDGRIISATYTHGRKRRGRSSITRLRRTAFKPLRGRISVLRYRCRPPSSFLQVAEYLKPQTNSLANRAP
ncbi:MAG: peptidoglycan endopeptidase, partial [Proteobacteria bacterium]